MTEAQCAIETAKNYVKKHNKTTFRLTNVRENMNLTDAIDNATRQLKTFEKEYREIQKTSTRIDKATDDKIKQVYIFRQERAYELLTTKVRSWFCNYQKDVIHAVDIIINNNMCNRSQRPYQCKPPVYDDHNRYYFGRTVCQGKTLAIRADCDGKFFIHGWLHYDSNTGANVELFDVPIEYIESNVVKFMTDIIIIDDSTEVITATNTEYHSNTKNTDILHPAKCNVNEDTREKTEYKTMQKQPNDGETNNTDSGSSSDSDSSSDSSSSSSSSDSSSSDSDSDDELPNTTLITKSVKSTAPIRLQPVSNIPGIYVYHTGLCDYLSKNFGHASLNVHALIMSRYSRRQRIYGLKESAYKKLLTTDASTSVPLKTQTDELRFLLLALWKQKQFICHPDVFATVAESRQSEYTYVADGLL
jgi:hypothetical protein